MSRARLASLASVSFALVVACGGATETNLFDPPPNGTNDGGKVDSGIETGPIPDGSNCGACGAPAPPGFHYVRYAEDRNGACPSGTTTIDVVSNLSDSVACKCTCTANTPDCSLGNLTRSSDFDPNNATCNQTGTTLTASAPNCTPFNNFTIQLGNHIKVNPPVIQGTCTTEAKPDLSGIKATQGRVCDAPAECSGIVCGGPKKCIAQQGDVACPAGFGNKTLVGTGANAKCEACPDCKADVQCTGTLSFFTNQQCTTGQIDMTADSQCVNRPVNSGGVGYVAYKYKGSVKSATCTPTGDTKGATVLEGQTTICCAN